MATLFEVQRDLRDKRERVKSLFDAHPDLDIPQTDVDEIQRLNRELNDLGAKEASMLDLQGIAADVKAKVDEDNRKAAANRLPTPQRMTPGEAAAEEMTIGERFAKSDSFNQWKQSPKVGRAAVTEEKTLVTLTVYTPQVMRQPGIRVGPANRLEHVADFIPSIQIDGPSIVFMTETTAANTTAATTVAEGGTKPEAAFTFAEVTVPVRKIAVNIPMTDEAIADVSFLQGYINVRLVESLKLTEDVQLISGNGTTPNITGLLSWSGIQTQAKSTEPVFDAILKGMTKVRVTGRSNPSGIFMHPTDWQNLALTRTADGLYILGNPAAEPMPRLWGLDVQVTDAETLGTALVGDFLRHTVILRRTGVTIASSTEHSTFFVENKVMLQAEERIGLLVDRASALCQVTGL
jgi:HK97 family phage major capsid protein